MQGTAERVSKDKKREHRRRSITRRAPQRIGMQLFLNSSKLLTTYCNAAVKIMLITQTVQELSYWHAHLHTHTRSLTQDRLHNLLQLSLTEVKITRNITQLPHADTATNNYRTRTKTTHSHVCDGLSRPPYGRVHVGTEPRDNGTNILASAAHSLRGIKL